MDIRFRQLALAGFIGSMIGRVLIGFAETQKRTQGDNNEITHAHSCTQRCNRRVGRYLLAAILGGLPWLAPAFDVPEAIATFLAVQAKGIVHLICEGLCRPCWSGPQFCH